MVEGSGSFVEPARMPGIRTAELLKTQVMAEFVAERAQTSAKQ